jgi:hypothetical protein
MSESLYNDIDSSDSDELIIETYDTEDDSDFESAMIKSVQQMDPKVLQAEIIQIESDLRHKCKARDLLNNEIEQLQMQLKYRTKSTIKFDHTLDPVSDSESEVLLMGGYESEHDKPFELLIEYTNQSTASAICNSEKAIFEAIKVQRELEIDEMKAKAEEAQEAAKLAKAKSIERYDQQCKAEAIQIAKKELRQAKEREQYELECKAEAKAMGEAFSDSEDDDTITSFPSSVQNQKNEHSESEMNDLRANKYYRLASMFDATSLTVRPDKENTIYTMLIFAFKNHETFTDLDRIFILREVFTKAYGDWDEIRECNLLMDIHRKAYGYGFSKKLLNCKWAPIQKIAKERFPEQFATWVSNRAVTTRQNKIIATVETDKRQDPVYLFVSQLQLPTDDKVLVNNLYNQYVSSTTNPLSKVAFGRFLNLHGWKSILIKHKKGRCYIITTNTIKSWCDKYLA